MTVRSHLKFFRQKFFISMVLMAFIAIARAEGTNAITNAASNAQPVTVVSNEDSLRSYLQIQEQLHNTLLTIEKNRQEAERTQKEAVTTAARTAEIIEGRLSLMEHALNEQHLEMKSNAEHSNRMVLIAAGSFALIGFLVLLLAAYMQWMAVSRLAVVAAKLPGNLPAPKNAGGTEVLAANALEQSTAKFLGVVEKLERRVEAIETGRPLAQLTEGTSTENDNNGKPPETESTLEVDSEVLAGKSEAINTLIGKGLTLLKMDKPAAAMDCFEEALALDPGHADAWVKKGAALERLQRLDEAIECYDLAIARDNSMTMAYLYKGGVFNRMERYTEALECYEQALRSKQKGQAANVIID